ncbi:Scr1 family TA system antitoxin-like transcriptional regulator [Micromonospora sp. NPDC005172]|uniref:Scr1 family TA system antitoxin-like transcriptional regulator n=1 Tax=Micromonospora sp. NPDC005172 TaxID=3156867 RepID=UPI0033B7D9BA
MTHRHHARWGVRFPGTPRRAAACRLDRARHGRRRHVPHRVRPPRPAPTRIEPEHGCLLPVDARAAPLVGLTGVARRRTGRRVVASTGRAARSPPWTARRGHGRIPGLTTHRGHVLARLSGGEHVGFGGGFVFADLPDGDRVLYLENAARGHVVDDPETLRLIDRKWDSLLGEALSTGASLDLIRKLKVTP